MATLPTVDLGGILLGLSAALRYIIIALLCVVALGAAKDFLTSNKAVADLVARLAPWASSKRGAPGTAAKGDGVGGVGVGNGGGGRKLRGALGSSVDGLGIVAEGDGGGGLGDGPLRDGRSQGGAELGDGDAFGFVDDLGSSRKFGGGGFSVL